MQNYIQPGDVMGFEAPYDVDSGGPALVGGLVVVATTDLASGDRGQFHTNGVFRLPKLDGQAWPDEGAKLYFDTANKRFDLSGSVGPLAGSVAAVAGGSDTTGLVRLNGTVPGTAEGPQPAIADLVDSSGGAVANGTIELVTPADTITDNSGGVDPGDDTIAAITQAANAGSADIGPTSAAIAQLSDKQNTTSVAVVALTDGLTELATKVNAILASLRAHGTISST